MKEEDRKELMALLQSWGLGEPVPFILAFVGVTSLFLALLIWIVEILHDLVVIG